MIRVSHLHQTIPFQSHALWLSLHFISYFFFSYRPMGSPKTFPIQLKSSVTLILIISLTFFPCNSGGSVRKQKKMVLGSRPPGCFNKCLTCKPCKAALVISPHRREVDKESAQRDEGYYLLSWKCKCGNKFFQP